MYNINFRNYAYSIMPSALRGTAAELIAVLASAFSPLHFRFNEYRQRISWLLSYNCSAKSIEDMLNNFFEIAEDENRRIRVTDGTAIASVVLYREAEHHPVILPCTLHSHTTWGSVPFVVEVPAELYYIDQIPNETVIGEIDKLVNLMKLYGLKHNTIPYN